MKFKRRVLLAWSCSFLAFMAASASGADPDPKTWKVGTSFRLSQLDSADQFVKLKQAGIEAVELGLNRLDTPEEVTEFSRRARQAHQWAESAGIEIWSVHIPYARHLDISESSEAERQAVVQRVSGLMDVYAPLRAQKLVIHASYEISKPIPAAERQARIAACRRSLVTLGRKATSMNAQLAVECLPRACIGNTSKEILQLLDGIDDVAVCLDTNHLLQEKTEDFVRKVGSRIVTLHVADYDGVDERHWLPGKGINNWQTIIQALQEVGYRGPWMFESAGTPEEKVAVWNKMKQSLLP